MKKILILFLTFGLFISCQDDSLDPIPERVPGAFVLLEVERPVIDVTQILTSTFGGKLIAPSNNVASYELFVRRFSGGSISEYNTLLTVTSFPFDLEVSAASVAAALGLGVEEILAGDRFDFRAESTDMQGIKTTFNNLGPDTQGEPGVKQAYQFLTYVSCPFDASESIGTYTILEAVFSDAPLAATFEVIAGSTPNELILVDPYNHLSVGGYTSPNNFQVVMQINDFGIVTIPETLDGNRQYLWNAGLFNPNWELVWPRGGEGFLFTCTGSLSFSYTQLLTLTSNGPAVFGFGARGVLVAKKN